MTENTHIFYLSTLGVHQIWSREGSAGWFPFLRWVSGTSGSQLGFRRQLLSRQLRCSSLALKASTSSRRPRSGLLLGEVFCSLPWFYCLCRWRFCRRLCLLYSSDDFLPWLWWVFFKMWLYTCISISERWIWKRHWIDLRNQKNLNHPIEKKGRRKTVRSIGKKQ